MLASLALDRPTRVAVEPPALDLARIVGPEAWARLPPALQRRFARHHPAARYPGTLTLERTLAGALFALLTIPFGSPLPLGRAAAADTVVTVWPANGGVVWERQIGRRRTIRSIKMPGPDGTLLERTSGGLGMVLDVSEKDGALVFTSRGFFLAIGPWRLPIPDVVTPGQCRVEHRALGESRFRFTLTMTHRCWGTTFRQSGVFTDGPA